MYDKFKTCSHTTKNKHRRVPKAWCYSCYILPNLKCFGIYLKSRSLPWIIGILWFFVFLVKTENAKMVLLKCRKRCRINTNKMYSLATVLMRIICYDREFSHGDPSRKLFDTFSSIFIFLMNSLGLKPHFFIVWWVKIMKFAEITLVCHELDIANVGYSLSS